MKINIKIIADFFDKNPKSRKEEVTSIVNFNRIFPELKIGNLELSKIKILLQEKIPLLTEKNLLKVLHEIIIPKIIEQSTSPSIMKKDIFESMVNIVKQLKNEQAIIDTIKIIEKKFSEILDPNTDWCKHYPNKILLIDNFKNALNTAINNLPKNQSLIEIRNGLDKNIYINLKQLFKDSDPIYTLIAKTIELHSIGKNRGSLKNHHVVLINENNGLYTVRLRREDGKSTITYTIKILTEDKKLKAFVRENSIN